MNIGIVSANIAANAQLQRTMMQLSTMQRINSAADDAAGLAISQALQAQVRGFEVGINNTRDMNNLVRTAEGGLSTISDSLHRIRELSLQASNGIMTASDRQMIQFEIDQLVDGIGDMTRNTQFNGINLLDGGFSGHTASDPSGAGRTVTIDNFSPEALGLAGFDVTRGAQHIDLGLIDRAMATVNAQRSRLGATMNTFDHTINANSTAMINMAAANSRIADLDVPHAMMRLSTESALSSYRVFMQRQQMDLMRTSHLRLMV
jgi:flagellin